MGHLEGEGARNGWIAALIALCAANPWPTLLLVALGGWWGWRSVQQVPLDAIPDLSDVQVIVYTEWPGRGPDLVEDQVTYPISTSLLAAPHVAYVRGVSTFGASFVYVIFDDTTDVYWARSRVLEYLATARGSLPPDVDPVLGPDATGVGWVYQYALVDDRGEQDLQQLRTLQDWTLRFALESVPGVAEVASIGGFVKQLQVEVDPTRLRAYGIAFEEVVDAVRAANSEVGGGSIEIAGHEHMIRGKGYVRSTADLAGAVVRVGEDGVPVKIGDLATVSVGPAERRGIAELDGRGEVVGGIVVMRHGENALQVIRAVEARLAEVTLPPGVRVVETYDRSELIEAAIDTLRHTLVEELVVVSLVIVAFLLHARSAFVPIVTLPIAVLLAFVPMGMYGITANLMSLGGIAVAIGAMVDASIILVENAHNRVEHEPDKPRHEVLVAAMQEVGPSIFFSLLVLTVSFMPVFLLEGTEGRLFRPLAWTKTFSMGFAALLAVTATPALVALLLRGRLPREDSNPLNRWLARGYAPVVRWMVRWRWPVVGVAAAMVLATLPVALSLDTEFMPPLDEGTLLYMPTAPPGISATEAARVVGTTDRAIKEIPEVRSVFGKMGRADTPTDPAPLGMAETTVVLAPKEDWRPGLTPADLLAELDRRLRVPGMPNLWWMPIQTRTEMLATGVRSPVGIAVYGDDLATIEATASRIAASVAQIPGTRSAFAERTQGGLYLDVEVDRDRAARYGLRTADVHAMVAEAIGGDAVDRTVEGRERYPIAVRYPRELRDGPAALEQVLVTGPYGTVPLSEVAHVRSTVGPDMIRSEDGKLVAFVFVDPGDVALGTWVERAQEKVSAEVTLPAGIRLGWTGQYRYYARAAERLRVVVPVTLLVVMGLLWLSSRSVVETAIVLLAVPFSLIGAFWLLWALDYHVSVAVWVGLLALAGLDAETGMVMLLYLTLEHDRRARGGTLRTLQDLTEAIVDGAARRLRPKLMTVLTGIIGLTPILWSTGVGADVTRRIAAPMVGGLVTSFALELLVYPAIFALWKGRELRAR